MKKLNLYFLNNNKLTVIVVLAIFLAGCQNNDQLLEKLNNDKELVERYNEFKKGEVEKPIVFSRNIVENIIDTALSYIGTPNKYGGITKDGIEYEQVCNVPTGCSYDDQTGECPTCELERKWDIEIVRDVVPVKVDRRVDKSLIGKEIEGRYQVTHAENTEGFFAIWEKGIYI